jgi:peroxiredoxin
MLMLIMPLQNAEADMLGSEAPDFTLRDLEGKPFKLSQYLGKTIMLVHFNVYCHTCREDVPMINEVNRLYRKYPDLQIVGIAIGNNEKETAEFKKAFKAEFLVLPDPKKEVYKKYFVATVPLVDIIDKSGTIRYRGKFPSYEELKTILDKIIIEKEIVGADLWNKPPDFSLMTSQGESFNLKAVIGKKTLLLTFLSIHDETIRQVIEIMKSLYSTYHREDIELIRIAVGDSPEKVNEFRKKYYVNFPILVDQDQRVARLYGVKDLPRVFIINKRGKIRYISDQVSLANVASVLVKVKSYFREELPEELLMKYLKQAAPGVKKFQRIDLGEGKVVYMGKDQNGALVLAREVFKDVLCDVCTNVHFVYSFDLTGKVKNIILIEKINLYGELIDAPDFLQRAVQTANRKLPLQLKEDLDGITGATQTSKLFLEGLNETPEIINSFKSYRDILARIPQ